MGLVRTMNPFRPPLFKRNDSAQALGLDDHDKSPPLKRRKLDSGTILGEPRLVFKNPGVSSLPRKPLCSVLNTAVTANDNDQDERSTSYYNVLW